MAAAVSRTELHALAWAIVTMVLLIVIIDQLFWRPLVTVADRYKLELSVGETPRSWVVDLWREARLPWIVGGLVSVPGA